MVAGATMSGDLSDEEWLTKLRAIGEKDGYFSNLGKDHASIFVERSHDVLFVGFETLFGIRSTSETGLPLAFDVCGDRGWSHLSLIAKTQTWFRDKPVWNYFDRLVDYGFFEDFDTVIFYGAGMCGYAAAAFSVVAPGAKVILISPQATLDRSLTQWDTRFPSARRLDFSDRYSYAPDMIEAASQALVVYDPDEAEDSMHASLFRGANVIHQRYHRGRAGAIEADFRALGLISVLAEHAAEGALTTWDIGQILKSRKRHVPYLRALLARVLAEDRPHLTAMLCRAVLEEKPIPRFSQHLQMAEKRIEEQNARRQRNDAGSEPLQLS